MKGIKIIYLNYELNVIDVICKMIKKIIMIWINVKFLEYILLKLYYIFLLRVGWIYIIVNDKYCKWFCYF